ncbi:MAG: hydrogenase expression/formation [Gammaproteobacteria bacterium]|jgi:hydrogenase maturation factor|nr:hydrogenase expression/formation [Gammaproteobacteria bacterium]
MTSPLTAGKLPASFLSSLIDKFEQTSPAIIIPPKIGIDAAGLKLNANYYAVSTDPITFTDKHIGMHSVTVNINDIACLGAKPKWFTATILLPEGIQREAISVLWDDLVKTLSKYGICAIGGHVEVTPVVKQTVIVGQMIGECIGNSLLDPRDCEAGDKILLWQAIGLEGSAIIASEHADKLASRYSAEQIHSIQQYIHDPGLCVWPVVEKLLPQAGVVALHDPTEGGVATALHEIANCADCGLQIQEEAIPILTETKAICALFGLDPLGLLSSGSLLIVCRPEVEGEILRKLSGEPITQLGELTSNSMERLLFKGKEFRALPQFDKDEIIKLQK